MISVVDAGIGNLRSIASALEYLGMRYRCCDRARDLAGSSAIVLPGVGNFGRLMRALESRGIPEELWRLHDQGASIVGICLGAQILLEGSEESPGVRGLGFIPGVVTRLPIDTRRIPNQGWQGIEQGPSEASICPPPFGYFSHSYAMYPEDPNTVTSRTLGDPGVNVVLEKAGILALQFHPEISGLPGVKYLGDLLRN